MMSGQRFGRLLIVNEIEPCISTQNKPLRQVVCICDCGKELVVQLRSLKNGNTRSCGCLQREKSSTHGASHTREYKSWESMWQRCTNPKATGYENYGGRGITICKRWIKFENFLEDMGPRPEGKTLDRYPNKNGNYEPENCRWATYKEQLNNTRWNKKTK